jgi:hypothetical protein
MSPKSVRFLYEAFGVAAFRKYGRNQLLKFTDQIESMKHVDIIKRMPAWAPPIERPKSLTVLASN